MQRFSRSAADGGRMKTLTTSARAFPALLVPCQSISNSTSCPRQRRLDRCTRRTVAVFEHDCGFEKFIPLQHLVELRLVDEMVVAAIGLAGRIGRVVADTDILSPTSVRSGNRDSVVFAAPTAMTTRTSIRAAQLHRSRDRQPSWFHPGSGLLTELLDHVLHRKTVLVNRDRSTWSSRYDLGVEFLGPGNPAAVRSVRPCRSFAGLRDMRGDAIESSRISAFAAIRIAS